MQATCKTLGVIVLDTNFPRPVGDIGNRSSFDFSVIYEKVPCASVSRVITGGPIEASLRELMISAAQRLERSGAAVIGTSCGFLLPLQAEISSEVSVPVVTSSLTLLPLLRAIQSPNRKIGVVTFDAKRLEQQCFKGAFESDLIVRGLPPQSELRSAITNDLPRMDVDRARNEVVDLVRGMTRTHEDIATVLFECTNLSPYRTEVSRATGLPVWDIVGTLNFLMKSTVPPP